MLRLTVRATVIACVLLALQSSAALAESEWLASGAPVTTAIPAQGQGEVTLTETKNKIAIKCKIVAADTKGTIGPGKLAEQTNIEPLECKSGVCSSATVTLDNLPWKTEITLVGSSFLDVVKNGGTGVPGWTANCVVLGILVEVLCEAILPGGVEDYAVELSNEAGGKVLDTFSGNEKGKCSNGAEGSMEGDVDETITGTGTVTVS